MLNMQAQARPMLPPTMVMKQKIPQEDAHNRLTLLMKLRSAGIRDTAVLNAMERVPRELFVNHPFNDRAYEDTALPIECGQTISQPTVVAWMTAALDLKPRMRVLEIGTGSGYQSVVLSHLCRMVYSIERYDNLLKQAKQRFHDLKIKNITTRSGDGYKGWPEAAPFDRIIATAAAPEVPQALLDQLSEEGGIMVIPIGPESGEQWLMKYTRTREGITERTLMGVRFVPMVAGSHSKV